MDFELKKADNENPSGSVKDKTYYMLYHTNGTTKKNWCNLNSNRKKMFTNSVDGQFTEGKEAIYNHVESLKSNIFNNPEQEKRNKELFASKNNEPQEHNHEIGRDYQKKNLRFNQDELIYAKADWKDPKSYLHFRNKSDTEESAHNRKLNELIGSREASNKKEAYSKHSQKEFETKLQQSIPSQDNHPVCDTIKVNKTDRLSRNYEVKNFSNVKDVNIEEIERVFKSKGMHIYGTKADNSYYNGKAIGRLTFSIRENHDDKYFKSKFDEAKESIKKETGLDIASASVESNQKKAIMTTVPVNVFWDNDRIHNYVRGRNIDTTINERTHSKGGYGAEKITMNAINHTYKKK